MSLQMRRLVEKIWFLTLLLALAPTTRAQESRPADASAQEQQDEELEKRAKAAKAKDELARSKTSFADRMFYDVRNNVSMTFSFFELYDSNTLNSSANRKADGSGSATSQIYMSANRRKFRLSFDYGGGYRFYHRLPEFNSTQHGGGINLNFQASRRASIFIADRAMSSPNDILTALNQPLTPIRLEANSYHTVYFDRQRIITNSTSAGLNYTLGRKSYASVYATYDVYRSRGQTALNTDAVQIGFRFGRQLNKWLSLDNSYSMYLKEFNNALGTSRVHRLEVGGLNFNLARTWTVFAGGGLELAEVEGIHNSGAQLGDGTARKANVPSLSVRGGIAKNSSLTNFALQYQRGFSSAVGLAAELRSQTVAMHFGRLLTRWMNFNLSSYYSRSTDLLQEKPLKSFSAGAGFEIAARRNLIFSVNGRYVDQQANDFFLDPPNLTRYAAYVGIQYLLPALRQ